jgi:site-specific DNA-methyltransferase (adenine-specific)
MLHCGDLFDVLPTLADESVDACVTDPPYGLGFMAKDWDVPGGIGAFPMRRRVETDAVNTGASRQGGRQRSCADFQKRQNRDAQAMQAEAEQWAREVFRVLKPGAHLVAFGGTRMYHRLTAGIEDAGFEIRDCLSWLYGSGFPKSLNVGNGQGTALKPAWEPIVLARKPTAGTVAANVLRHSTGALNIDACRIVTDDPLGGGAEKADTIGREGHEGWDRPWKHDDSARATHAAKIRANVEKAETLGRWPANVLLDEDAATALDEQTGDLLGCNTPKTMDSGGKSIFGIGQPGYVYGDSGGASRFYYVAKPSREERDMGCYDLPHKQRDDSRKDGNPGGDTPRNRGLQPRGNFHPTVKPVELMRWLVRLVTPINGTVLDPFTGSGTTGMACAYEQRQFIGIEREAEYVEIAERRIASVAPLFTEAV